MSRPPDWELRMAHVKRVFREKDDALYAALILLEDEGYLIRQHEARRGGHWNGVVYQWYEEQLPLNERRHLNKKLDSPFRDLPETVEPEPVNPDVLVISGN